jgi:hypothetical protein
MMLGPTELLVIFGLIAVVVLGAFVIFRRGRWAVEGHSRHGLRGPGAGQRDLPTASRLKPAELVAIGEPRDP